MEMNKTITIYELLGLVKDGKAPKKIKYEEDYLLFDDVDNDYYNEKTNTLFIKLFSETATNYVLNDTIEIIEDNDKLEKIEITGEQIKTFYDGGSHFIRTNTKDRHLYIPTLNKIINHINKIEEKLDEK